MLTSEHEPLTWAQYYVMDRDSEIEVTVFSFSSAGNQELLGALLIVPELMAVSPVGRLYKGLPCSVWRVTSERRHLHVAFCRGVSGGCGECVAVLFVCLG